MPRARFGRLAQLARSIGRQSASQELKWMRNTNSHKLAQMLDRRIRGEPLQYILGTTPFGPLNLLTRTPTLIPRPETEDWSLRLASLLSPTPTRPVNLLDLCTGSGCIPLLLCHLWPPGSTRAVGVDISKDAIRLATDNAARCNTATTRSATSSHLRNVFTPLLGDISDPSLHQRLEPPFDILTANPPYIPQREYVQLSSSVRDYEDPRALLGDPPGSPNQDGLSFYHIIASFIARKGILRDGAIIALEVGHDQANAVQDILRNTAGLHRTEIWKDPWDKDRVVFARV